MTDETFAQRTSKRVQQEYAEFHADAQRTGQAQLDHWWQSRLDEEAEYRRLMKELNPTGLRIWD